MTTLTPAQAQLDAQEAGFSGTSLQDILAIAQAESGLRTNAVNCNNPGGTCDRGIVQINNYWHPEVSDQCAYDPVCAFQAAFSISSHGTNFNPWTTYKTGVYQQFLSLFNATPGGGSDFTGASPGSTTTTSPIGDSTFGGVPSALDPTGTLGGISSITSGFQSIFGWMGDKNNWIRLGLIISAILIIIVGLKAFVE